MLECEETDQWFWRDFKLLELEEIFNKHSSNYYFPLNVSHLNLFNPLYNG